VIGHWTFHPPKADKCLLAAGELDVRPFKRLCLDLTGLPAMPRAQTGQRGRRASFPARGGACVKLGTQNISWISNIQHPSSNINYLWSDFLFHQAAQTDQMALFFLCQIVEHALARLVLNLLRISHVEV
jgi:hypothetical protein